ncbi:MAG: RagB/SusD family nutrient uptake outer membrane protein [Bacteroidales bacterium]|nr:RagB/SusD family nutrient uptake outer membrane protein [Bacteroidales bacterium]
MKNFVKYIFGMLLLVLYSACSEDFLDRPPLDRVTVDNYSKSFDELRAGTSALYNIVWFDYNERAGYSIGDIRGGNTLSKYFNAGYYRFTVNSLDANLYEAWSALYKVVAQSNTVMSNISLKAENITDKEKNAAIAECRFMRATAYFHLVRAWGPVMIIEDNIALVDNPIIPLNPVEDVYKFIIADLTWAARYLPETDDPGRVTRWSAEGMLAKVYLAFSGYGSTDGLRNQALLDSAQYYAADVCRNSGMELMDNYADLFKYKSNVNRAGSNNMESLFSLLWVPLGVWGSQNATLSDFAFHSDVVGGISAWGSHRASYDILALYQAGDTIRLDATFMTDGVHYPEINSASGGYTYSGTETCPLKKYVPGGPDDNEGDVAVMNSPLNSYILRLADVYLVYAEASLGNSSELTSGEGLTYFNKVRARAGMPELTSVDFEDLIYERRIELAMEYQYWYDLVTWYYFKPQFIIDYINGQERGAEYTHSRNPDGSLTVTVTIREDPPTTVTADDIYFPYPESEMVQNPSFNQEPVPYDFGE